MSGFLRRVSDIAAGSANPKKEKKKPIGKHYRKIKSERKGGVP
jgi:hypothetical protein